MLHIPSNALPHQVQSIHRIIHDMHGRCLLAFEMGMGKTFVACVVAEHYKGKTLVIAPSSKLFDWKHERMAWTATDSQIIKKGTDAIENNNVIASYAMAKNHAELLKTKWDTIICDESHNLKENDSLQTRRILPILKRAEHVLLLSGTPQLSRPYELYPQLAAVQDVFGDFYAFTKQYCAGHQDAFGWNYRGVSNVEELQDRMKPLMIRVGKCEMLTDLPVKRRNVVLMKCSEIEHAAFREMSRRLRELQNVCTKSQREYDKHKADAEMMECWRQVGRMKMPHIIKWLDNNIGKEKLVVYVHHLFMMDEIEAYLKSKNIASLRIDGSTSAARRQKLLDPFKTMDDMTYQVAILSLTACSAGINLVPGVWRVCFAELHWSPSTFLQAEDRFHRIGAVHEVECYYLVVEHSFDVDMFNILLSKEERNATVMNEDTKFDFATVEAF